MTRRTTTSLRHPAVPLSHVGTFPRSFYAQDDDISGIVRYRTYEVLKEEANNPRLR